MEQDPIPQDNRPEWLRALTEKSWNLELIISGAAIYLTSHLPETVDSMLRYYLESRFPPPPNPIRCVCTGSCRSGSGENNATLKVYLSAYPF